MKALVSVSEARRIIDDMPGNFGVEQVALRHALHRVLAEDILADSDFPPFDRVMMDGIAISYSTDHPEYLQHQDTQRAGQPALTLLSGRHAIEIMTGAVCPAGADTIIPYEDCERNSEGWKVIRWPERAGVNIHRRAADQREGDILLRSGSVVGAAEAGVLASVGKAEVKVYRRPTVIVFSTGDELVPIASQPLPHQVRRSNVESLLMMLGREGIDAHEAHLPDDQDAITEVLHRALSEYDVILLSGGVSKGKFDLLPAELERLGVTKYFHGVKQKPGKPFWFGTKGNCTVFAFPGNPVSTFVCAHVYLLPWLRHKAAFPAIQPTAEVANTFKKKTGLTHFVPGRFTSTAQIALVPGNGSGDFVNLVQADLLVEFPEDMTECKPGDQYPFILFRE
ncbi:MAG: molybdopterin molybdotransferase MoeA [Flavobacteriales bacterium]|nr:molybdopterin molybdotransferase MoeA [Flavobacteriales bacterium]